MGHLAGAERDERERGKGLPVMKEATHPLGLQVTWVKPQVLEGCLQLENRGQKVGQGQEGYRGQLGTREVPVLWFLQDVCR